MYQYTEFDKQFVRARAAQHRDQLERFEAGQLSADEFKPLRDSLLAHGDPFLVMADYDSYAASQAEVDKAYRDQSRWQKMAIHNTARVGKFSSDRTILEYAKHVWKLPQVSI